MNWNELEWIGILKSGIVTIRHEGRETVVAKAVERQPSTKGAAESVYVVLIVMLIIQ